MCVCVRVCIPKVFQCWASVEDAGPTLKHHWVNCAASEEDISLLVSPGTFRTRRCTYKEAINGYVCNIHTRIQIRFVNFLFN